MEYSEDEQDIKDAEKAIKQIKRQGSKPLQQLAKELGINLSLKVDASKIGQNNPEKR